MLTSTTIRQVKRQTERAILTTFAIEWHEQVIRRDVWIPKSAICDNRIAAWFALRKANEVLATTNVPKWATPIIYTV